MIDRAALLDDLKKRLRAVEADLGRQVKAVSEVGVELRTEYDRARELGRTAATWNAWLDERVTQVAVAWVLGTVFVRFCEDNRLVPEPYITAPEPDRRDVALVRYEAYVERDDDPTYRGWLLLAFAELGSGQAGRLLFDQRHNPLYQIPLSHDGARELIDFWRERDGEGFLIHDFTDPLEEDGDGTEGWDTRFLGDLYQDLSEAARKTYALLQTPEFVEEFILDRAMNPAVREFGYEGLLMIDPTCGSGHFVLGAFRRLVRLWGDGQPGRDLHERVRSALDSVHGVDVNPFAVAIARFRLLMAAMAAAGVRTLAEANRYEWPLHLAVGDSLIKARQTEIGIRGTKGQGALEFTTDETDELAEFSYATEDLRKHPGILTPGRYHVVVGNPPYIQVADSSLNRSYRDLYDACAGTYALSVPFAQRFFELARNGSPDGRGYGMVGQITANSFMKREFGTKLIESYFRDRVELTEVIDTSGAYIPGHGTPTVILVGKRREGSGRSATIRTVRSVQGEPATPEQAQDGLVWRAILEQIDDPGSASQWVSVDDLERGRYFGKQPWILTDGGLEMVEQIGSMSPTSLGRMVASIGRTTSTGADDIFFLPDVQTAHRLRVAEQVRCLAVGDGVRNYAFQALTPVINPYSDRNNIDLSDEHTYAITNVLWRDRTRLRQRKIFGKTLDENHRSWYVHLENYSSKLGTSLGIAFSFVATHNHFTLDRKGLLFNRSAPVIKLKEETREEAHLKLLGLLNSSTAGFWLRQMSQGKGGSGLGCGIQSEAWEERYEFSGSKLEEFPLPSDYPLPFAAKLDALAQQLIDVAPATVAAQSLPTVPALREAQTSWHAGRSRMIALQEELDWQVYSIYELFPEDLRVSEDSDDSNIPEINLGERAFEIVLARKIAAGEASDQWFKRHGSTPITEIPEHWPAPYREVVQKRIDAIESTRAIGMIERPEYKRRWATEGWDSLQEKALRRWLLDRIENREHWFDENGMPCIVTLSRLTDVLSRDDDFVSVARIYAPRKELPAVVAELVSDEHVPFLAALRYKPSGMKKRADWEHVWDEQRKEDAAPDEAMKRKIRDSIPVPPKYTSADFLRASYWKARGKLDVPKERFVSYGQTNAATPNLYGWAGWDHQEQAYALFAYIASHESMSAEELTPFLTGLLELQPWLDQWHDDFDPTFSGSPAAYFRGERQLEQGKHGLTDDGLRAWRPAAPSRGRRPAKK
ncbi:BREX-2 system adenine-specific DNA-methyltransferase PglX [Streptomyces sp. TS71-3]|uniref:BREX-2 system adenine-specific DNA-methyltransferase PglX n=1 Tax=Streptomyces sp. TS71-3 TaxID=2733862 RepID=UPI001B019F26|nr:BREX-2 system adenine-specific DNA-methyltransferase PglX [Streptomyces sp. TS71-3]GHJ36008.1 DNA methylase [Streptomyces sp. TS71-3]